MTREELQEVAKEAPATGEGMAFIRDRTARDVLAIFGVLTDAIETGKGAEIDAGQAAALAHFAWVGFHTCAAAALAENAVKQEA